MKLLTKLSIACALLTRAYPLQCLFCASVGARSCVPSTIQTCETGQTCISGTGVTFVGSSSNGIRTSYKSCATSTVCNSGSVSTGSSRTTFNNECCDTNLCNNQTIPALTDNLRKGKRCLTCEPGNCTDTLRPMDCLGLEDHCFTVSFSSIDGTLAAKGCASQRVCTGAMNGNTPTAGLSLETACCEGNMCNNALHVRQSVLLLLGSLSSMVLLH